jgi:hypothetical protein
LADEVPREFGNVMAKGKPKREEEREHRITMEIVVDAYDAQERAMGWYCYLQDQLQFPFTATCIAERDISRCNSRMRSRSTKWLAKNECEHEMFVTIRWEKKGLAVLLTQLKLIDGTEEQTREAVADWHYWVEMGYEV